MIYAPWRRAAFIGNERVPKIIRDLQSGSLIPDGWKDKLPSRSQAVPAGMSPALNRSGFGY